MDRSILSQPLRLTSMIRKLLALSLTSTLVLSGCSSGIASNPPGNGNANTTPVPTVTPTTASASIKHVVVIFGENISFDHYFGTYPNAANTGGTTFTAAAGTPTNINNYVSNPTLLTANPNLAAGSPLPGQGNQGSAANPFRLGPNQAATADQDHNYAPEQVAFDNGKMDLFPFSVGTANTATLTNQTAAPA